jgi:transposase
VPFYPAVPPAVSSIGDAAGRVVADRRRNAGKASLRGLVRRDGVMLGIDLGEDKQALALVDHDVQVLWRKSVRVKAHQLGTIIDAAVAAVREAGRGPVTVGEPTGLRWLQVQRLCRERGLALVCIQPLVSHASRRQQDLTGHKRDGSDAVMIARLASELHCHVPEELDEAWALLRDLGRRRAQLARAETAPVVRIRDFLSVAWPSALSAAADPFKSKTWLAAVEVVTRECGPAPGKLAGLGGEAFAGLVREALPGWGVRRISLRIARNMLAVLDDPDAVTWTRRGPFRRIREEFADLQRCRALLAAVEDEMEALVAGELGLARLAEVPGLSLTEVVVILAEAGDPRRYDTSRSLVKHAGPSPADTAFRRAGRRVA